MTDPNPDRIEAYRQRLERMLEETIAQRVETAGDRDVVQLDQQSVGRLSRIDAMQAQQMALAADRLRQNTISRIRRALHDIADGEFGCCKKCGGEIPNARLQADPTAHLCLGCASSRQS